MLFSILYLLVLPIITVTSVLQEEQIVMDAKDQYTPLTHSKPSIADLLTIEPSVSIFYSYARELELSNIFSDKKSVFTVLVPTNKAVMALSRKPHQGPPPSPSDSDIEISEEEFEKTSKQNVLRWVSAHIITGSSLPLLSRQYDTLLSGKTVNFTPITPDDKSEPEWRRVTLEDGVRILEKKEASNGDIYLIDGTINSD